MGATRPRVLISQPIPASALDRLRGVAEVEMGENSGRIMPRAELLERVRRADCLFHLMHDAVDTEVIAAGTGLRVIASMSIVPATVDVDAATARRIPVTTIPPIVTEATADLHWALLLAVARRLVEADGALRLGVFPGSQSLHFAGAAVHGKTLRLEGDLGSFVTLCPRKARGDHALRGAPRLPRPDPVSERPGQDLSRAARARIHLHPGAMGFVALRHLILNGGRS